MHCLLVIPIFVGVCVCFLQGLSIGIDALFIGNPNICRGLCLFLARSLYWYRCTIFGTPNVCRGFVSVSCKDSL